MSRDILIVAFHFPPILQSSGVHRTVAFAEHLVARGHRVEVLTIREQALPAIDPSGTSHLDARIRITRARGVDATRAYSIAGRYPGFLAVPDRYRSWIRPTVRAGKRLLANMRRPAIFSTFPIPSAHEIASRLSQATGAPWIADFRDPMWVPAESTPALERLEAAAVNAAQAITVTTPATQTLFAERYGETIADKVHVIENGFGRTVRETARREREAPSCDPAARPIVVLHSGSVYNEFRNPTALFEAIAACRDAGDFDVGDIEFVFRGAALGARLQKTIDELAIAPFVKTLPMIGHAAAVEEMARAHAYLVLQGRQFNAQVPAKVYEYLAMRRPILAGTDARGATAAVLAQVPGSFVCNLEDAGDIRRALCELVHTVQRDPAGASIDYDADRFDRARGAEILESCLISL